MTPYYLIERKGMYLKYTHHKTRHYTKSMLRALRFQTREDALAMCNSVETVIEASLL